MCAFHFLICCFTIYLGTPQFLGDALRVAVITAWAELNYLDTFSCVAGMDLSRFTATSLPYVWIAVFAFIDYPISLSAYTSVHFQLFGFVIAKVYALMARKSNWIPDEWNHRQHGELREFVPPVEMFVYLVIAVLRGGSFM